MNNRAALLYVVFLSIAVGIVKPSARGGEVTFEGTTDSLTPYGIVMLGTFRPGFDPFTYPCVYGIDEVCNMSSPNYSRAVNDGNFRPIGMGYLNSGSFAGAGTALGIEGQQLWVFLFNSRTPDMANLFALCTGTSDAWRAPSDGGSTQILANSADVFVFGYGGYGGPISTQILPIPEPSSAALLFVGVFALALLSPWRRPNAEGANSQAGK